MFESLLIANRGEIACRVAATARRMGVVTHAVYSEADAQAKHVAVADHAWPIGPATAAESYLRIDALAELIRRLGVDAVHPGYGFLSENADFADAVAAAGATFVGPPASAIRAMGLKDAAKALMCEAGVPVVPGYHGSNQDPDFLAREAERIGYPVLIKARAGGGGKGMRRVDDPTDFRDALASAQREAASSFGDPVCLIEKYVAKPRHVEIQVFADAHGGVVHLFERDCSLQRRHQKVIEEAPAPGISEEVRAAMGAAAVEAARAIGYQSAGTVEFIADGSGPLRLGGFWFMEMNTRLQVEHPVTEAITGLDLVETQLRVAAGEPLPFAQDDLQIEGHAVEARLYAEDAAAGFLPSTGRLARFRTPVAAAFENAAVRVDSGVREGDAITRHYDPMIAKVIVRAADRAQAFDKLARALGGVETVGVTTNRDFLVRLARHEGVVGGDVDTGLIARDLEALTAAAEPPLASEAAALAEAGVLGAPGFAEASGRLFDPRFDPRLDPRFDPRFDPWAALTDWRAWERASRLVRLERGGDVLARRVSRRGDGRFDVSGDDGEARVVAVEELGGGRYRLAAEAQTSIVAVQIEPSYIVVIDATDTVVFARIDPLVGDLEEAGGGDEVSAPMPGLVKVVAVEKGARVAKGDTLFVMEAMKMELALAAPRDGVVAEVLVGQGEQVAEGAPLARFEAEETAS